MFDPTLDTCQKCPAGISYIRFRISEESLKKACHFICSKSKKNLVDETTPNLFDISAFENKTNAKNNS